jgi:hypothetical protein
MYTESRNNFNLRNVILQFLFIALLVFILIWLFPTKKDMKKATNNSSNGETKVKIDNSDLTVLYDRIFNENLMSMKEAAQSYYTIERLPQKVGDSTKITLKEMIDKKIILPFKDKDGKQCDLNSSYVQITKNENEYVMKVNLKCGDEENYLLTYMGCYDYCSQTICEKEGTTGKVYKVETKTTEPKKTVTPIEKAQYRTLYEYKKTTKGTEKWSDWSPWLTTKVTPSNTIEVESKTETANETYYTDWSNWSTTKVDESKTRQVETKTETKTEEYYTDWSNWSTTKVDESKTRQVETKTESKTEQYYTDWSDWSTTKVSANSTRQVETKKESKTEQYYTDWSDWSTTKVSASSTRQVQSKDVKYRKLIGYNVITEDDLSKPITEFKDVVVASSKVTSCSSYNLTSTVTGYTYKLLGTFQYSTAPVETSTYTYKKVGEYSWYCDGNCTAGTVLLYEKYQKVPQTTSSYSCAKYETTTSAYVAKQLVVTGYEKKQTKEPVYEYYTKTQYRYRDLKTKTINTTYYRYRDLKTKTITSTYYRYRDLITKGKTVTFYRYRTKTVTPGTVSLKWSTYNDTKLLNNGYNYTGNTKTEKIK